MKYVIGILALVFMGCASKKTEQKKDFSIQKITIKEEKKESNIIIKINSVTGITFMDIYYKNNMAKINFDEQNKTLSSQFKKGMPRDINLSADPKEEYGNKAPIQKSPAMDENELIISYKKTDNKIILYKINYQKFLDEKSSK